MAIDTRIQIPWSPSSSISEQILSAIQLANVQNQQQRQLALQQQGQQVDAAYKQAEISRLHAQTELERNTLEMNRNLIGALTGNTPGATPSEQASAAAETSAAPSGATIPASSSLRSSGGSGATAMIGPGATPSDSAPLAGPGSAANFLQDLQSRQFAGAPAPAPSTKQSASGLRGIIGQTVDSLLQDPDLKPEDRKALITAGSIATLKAFADPSKAMDGVTSTYNDILTRRGEAERAIKTEVMPDSKSSTGYSTVATHPDGTQAYKHEAPAPVPKDLQEASAYLGSAALNYQREPTEGNKAALRLAEVQHNAMYHDKIAEASQQARATAMAQGKDAEAMFRTGVNPITKEKLSLNNAPPGALVNPTTGEVIPQDMVSLYKPTQNEKQTADTARQVLAISQNLRDEIAKNPSLIGPIAGRSQEALQKLGLSKGDASKMLDDLSFLQSAATKMHTGRFSAEILKKMGDLVKPGMNKAEFLGALDSVNDVATRYANEDKLTTVYEYQQRLQFENQGGAAGPVSYSSGNPFAPKP